MTSSRSSRERGAAGLLALLVALGFAVVISMVTVLAVAVIESARVQSAADAVALAEASREQGQALADANGVAIVNIERRPPCVEVLVRRGRFQARARAIFDWDWGIASDPDAACPG